MAFISFLLNMPWTVLALLPALLSVPTRVAFNQKPFAILISVKSFWWKAWLPGYSGVRATTLGSVVLLGGTLKNDLEHELVHVEQYQRAPLIHPFLYVYQSLRHGYRQNIYEQEAYARSGNQYIEKKEA